MLPAANGTRYYSIMKVKISELRHHIESLLSMRFTAEESARITDYLIWADMSGIVTQGIIKMTGTEPLQAIKPKHDITVERDTPISQLINAGAYPAPLVSQRATDVAIEKAKKGGFAIVGVHNTFSSNGAQAYYAGRMAQEDLIGIVMARSPGSVAPFGSIDPLFGTNPVGFAFPTNNEPLVFDMATSAMTWYGLVLAKAKGQKIPTNMAIDHNGKETIDPADAMKGALHPFDHSYKSAGLGMVVEIMSGPLAASAYCDCETFDKEWGSTFIAIDPGLLVDVKKFKSECSDLVSKVKTSRTNSQVRLPGERALETYKKAESTGEVEVEDVLLKELEFTPAGSK